jgi:hypothetical protein
VNVAKMRHQLERAEDAYQWRSLSARDAPPVPPALKRFAETMAQIAKAAPRLP